MVIDTTVINDPNRLAALNETGLLGTQSEVAFDRITRLTTKLLRVPVALVSLVDANSQFFKSCVGLSEPWATIRETPLSHSFCQHVVTSNLVLRVVDARLDPLLQHNAAISDLGVVAYLGAPLRTSHGHTLGALCAIDSSPRDWSSEDVECISDLAALVISEVEARQICRTAAATQAMVRLGQEQSLLESHIKVLADSMQQIIWTADANGVLQYCNKHWIDFSGMSLEQTRELGCQAVMHPDDIAASRARRQAAFAVGEPYESEYRFKRAGDGMYRWHLGRVVPLRDSSGKIIEWLGTCIDIHEKKTSSQALERSRDEMEKSVRDRTAELTREHQFLEAVLENITDGVVACDETGVLKLFNRATREFHGLPEEQLPPEKWAEHYSLFRADGVTPMTMDEVPLLRAFNGEMPKDVEMVIVTHGTGRRRRVITSGRAFYNVEGNKLGAVAAMREITAQRAAEERFRLLFDCSSVAKFLLQDGKVLDCNLAAVELLGCASKANLLQMHPADFSPEFQPDGRPSGPTRQAIDQNVLVTGSDRFEWNLRKADGTDIFVDVSLTAIKLDGKDAIISACHDITQRKHSESALAEAKRFAESVADHSSCSIYIRRLEDEALTYLNKQTREFIGLDRGHISEKGQEFNKEFFHPDDLAKVQAARQAIKVARDGEVVEYQARGRHASGEWRHLLHRQVVFQRLPDGTPSHIMGTAQDISALLKIQGELIIAKDAAEAATRAKTEFLANMSHEIRTPMTAILGYTDLLVDPDQTADQRADHAKVVRRNGEHLLSVLNDILDITKIEAGKMAIELLEVDPTDILAQVRTLSANSALDKGLAFGIEQKGHLPELILTDPTRLKQVLLNLVSNAIKFTIAGSVRLTASYQTTNGSQQLRFDVTDTGIGLTSAQQSRLFNAFVQADTSTNRRFGGTGLGLVISKRLANMLGGDLSVTSELGIGSTFSLVLNIPRPLTTSSISPNLSQTRTAPARTKASVAGRILVAEDTTDTRRLVTLYLEDAGAVVEAVSNGLLAVDAVRAAADRGNPFDMVLMDIQMPELDGYQATQKLRELGFHRLPIIAFTAHALVEERQRCLQAGCNDCVSKPIDYDELFESVRKYTCAAQHSIEKAASTLRSLRHDDGLVRTILNDYIAGLPEHAAEIADSLAEENLAHLRLKVHQLRGSGGSYGFPQLSQKAQQAELLIAESKSLEQITNCVQELLELLRSVDGYDHASELLELARRR